MPLHARALAKLKSIAEGNEPAYLPVFCLPEFIKVVTHPRYFSPPTTLETAFDNLKNLMSSPSIRGLFPGERFPTLYRELSLDTQSTGQLAFDAAIVAVCLEHGVNEILTEDRDFSRFGTIACRRLPAPRTARADGERRQR